LFNKNLTADCTILTACKTVNSTSCLSCGEGSDAVTVSTGTFLSCNFSHNTIIGVDSFTDSTCQSLGCRFGRFTETEVVGSKCSYGINRRSILLTKCGTKSCIIHNCIISRLRNSITKIYDRSEIDNINGVVFGGGNNIKVCSLTVTLNSPEKIKLFVIGITEIYIIFIYFECGRIKVNISAALSSAPSIAVKSCRCSRSSLIMSYTMACSIGILNIFMIVST